MTTRIGTGKPLTPPIRDPHFLAEVAVDALIFEAHLTPKPGLVDSAGSGAHSDMDIELLFISAETLRPTFVELALAGRYGVLGPNLRSEVGRIGREGESRVLDITNGVNTHRGALWALGLLVTSAALSGGDAAMVTDVAARLATLPDPSTSNLDSNYVTISNGERVRRIYQIGGARAEAKAGFPHALAIALPVYQSRLATHGPQLAAIDALLAVMASLQDTCVVHRGGLSALALVHEGVREVLLAGGSCTTSGMRRLKAFDQTLTIAGISPGGSADLLAAGLFLEALSSGGRSWRSCVNVHRQSLHPRSSQPSELQSQLMKG